METEKYWIIDTDYSYDDYVILPLLLSRLNVVAITTVGTTGISPVAIKKIIADDLKYPKEQIFPGSSIPFIDFPAQLRDEPAFECYFTKEHLNKLKEASKDEPLAKNEAPLAIINLIAKYGKALSILTLGPLTNIALVSLLKKNVSTLFDKLLITGGSLENWGNAGTSAEYHFKLDPIAAASVFEAYGNVTLVPLEVERNLVKHLNLPNKSEDTAVAKSLKEIHENDKEHFDIFLLGIIGALVAVDEGSVIKRMQKGIRIDTLGRFTRGGIIFSKFNFVPDQNHLQTEVILEVSEESMRKFIY